MDYIYLVYKEDPYENEESVDTIFSKEEYAKRYCYVRNYLNSNNGSHYSYFEEPVDSDYTMQYIDWNLTCEVIPSDGKYLVTIQNFSNANNELDILVRKDNRWENLVGQEIDNGIVIAWKELPKPYDGLYHCL